MTITTFRFATPVALVGLALCLASCNEASGPMATGPVTTAAGSVASSSLGLPPGAPCSGEIARYESVVRDDLRTGNVEQKVYDQIQVELKRAAAACRAGHGGEAHAIVTASKSRHGYEKA